MRMMLKAAIDTDAGNEFFRRGMMGEGVDRWLQLLQPEALYGFIEDGQRTLFAVFELADPSQIQVFTESIFNFGRAKITLTPCMTLEDIKKGAEEAARVLPPLDS
jgi:hypothetical protein